MDAQTHAALRALPSVDAIVREECGRVALDEYMFTELVRIEVAATRAAILDGNPDAAVALGQRIEAAIALVVTNDVTTVINATGVIVHTNLGRSPVSKATADAMSRAAQNYVPLEVQLASAERGGRGADVGALLGLLTGAEASMAVNNNAAAILLALSALCQGKRVIVSRGEAVEIGGGFRIPDVMRQSGAQLVEVGTTNRTNLADYAAEIDDDTAAILSVHASNFAISGFTSKPQLAELADLAHERGILLIEDVGSGCLVETERYGLVHEPTLRESIEAGVDVVTASGDKLLGGPQAGLILGKQQALDLIRRHPFARAIRTDKTVQEGLAATLRHYARGEHEQAVPIWWMMSQRESELRERAERWQAALASPHCRVVSTRSVTGGGSLPGKSQPSAGIALQSDHISAAELARRLRTADLPVFPRVEDERVILDCRTVLPDQDEGLLNTVGGVLSGLVGS